MMNRERWGFNIKPSCVTKFKVCLGVGSAPEGILKGEIR